MNKIDARTLTPKQQETLRKTAVRMVYQEDYTQREAGNAVGVTRQEVCGWCRKYEKYGMSALDAKSRGRKPGEKTLLEPWQCAQIVSAISDKTPDQLKLPFVLWTRAAVRDYIEEKFGVCLKLNTMGNYLKRWGFTPQKPVKRAYEQNPKALPCKVQDEKGEKVLESACLAGGPAPAMLFPE